VIITLEAIRLRSPAPSSLVLVGLAGGDEAVFVGDGDEGGAVVAVELVQDVADMAFCGQWADDELPGDLSVAEPAGDEDEDVALAVSEFSQAQRRL